MSKCGFIKISLTRKRKKKGIEKLNNLDINKKNINQNI